MSQPESTESVTNAVHVECGFYIRDHATNGDCPMLLGDYMDTQKPGLVTFTRDQLVSTPERKAGVRPGVVAEVREYPAPEVGLAEGVYTPAMAEQVGALQRAHGEAERLRRDYSLAAKYRDEYRDDAHSASEALLEMIDRVEAAEAKVAAVEALHYAVTGSAGVLHWCQADGRTWPCPTIRALGGE